MTIEMLKAIWRQAWLAVGAAALGFILIHPAQAAPVPSPVTGRQAINYFELEPGLQAELVAEEPQVVAPVALAFDAAGRLFVAENRDYPNGPGPGEKPLGQIALLEDRNGDGFYESRTTFADQLHFPNGLMPWKDGLIVTCAPDVWFLQDTNGDGVCDRRTIWFTGFGTNGSSQLRVSHPTLASDGWIYLASGLTGGKIFSPLHPEIKPVDIGAGDFRFRPDLSRFEMVDGKSQFGLFIDDFNNRFTCMNRVHIKQVVLPSRYLKRNPSLLFSETVQNLPESTVPEPLKGHLAAARIYPLSENVTTADSHAGTFTAACGLLIYQGRGLPRSYWGQAFACDPTGNLVHRDELVAHGPTFFARRSPVPREFLASRDNWFRPVFLADGPDSALYLCDMYRKTIEHPQYLPEEVRKRTDFESGRNLGRIYRVRAKANGGLGPRSRRLGHRGGEFADLNESLASSEGWERRTAFRLLTEDSSGREPEARRQWLRILRNPGVPPESTALALRLLEQKGWLDETNLKFGFQNTAASVRRVALQLAEDRLGSETMASAVSKAAGDSSATVRFQAALALGFLSGTNKIAPLAQIALADAEHRWTRAAVLSGISNLALPFLNVLSRRVETFGEEPHPGRIALFLESARLAGLETAGEFPRELTNLTVLKKEDELWWKIPGLNGLVDSGSGKSSSGANFSQWIENQPGISNMMIQARARLGKGTDPLELKMALVSFLGRFDPDQSRALLWPFLDPSQPTLLQQAVVTAMIKSGGGKGFNEVIAPARWLKLTPAVKEFFIQSVLSSSNHLPALLTAIEEKKLPASIIDSTRRNQLKRHPAAGIREKAELLFAQTGSADRMKIYEDLKSVLTEAAQAKDGREVFNKNCSSCHRLNREGVEVGPDLFSIRNQPREVILLHLLIPDFEVVPGFTGYLIETRGGETLTGLIASETPTALTLKQALGVEKIIPRSDILSLEAIGSLMPQEMEKNMTRQELADLIAYLKGE